LAANQVKAFPSAVRDASAIPRPGVGQSMDYQWRALTMKTTLNTHRKILGIAAGIAVLACASHFDAHAATVCTADPDSMNRWYGIAGGPVGSDAIARTAKCDRTLRANAPEEMHKWYGIAGGPVGADAIAAGSHPGPSVSAGNEPAGTVYGRAGGLVGAEAIAASTKHVERQAAATEARGGAVK
jgi:hypothetical protein